MNNKFLELELSERVLQGIMAMGFSAPSKIQAAAIPVLLEGKDIIGQAQTGTGKTLAFGSVVLSRVSGGNKYPQAIIVSPTRELAMQIEEELKRIGKYVGARTTCVYGGSSYETQIRALKRGVDIVVGTPGRIMDLMRKKVLKLCNIEYVVLDEADEMLNMGFVEDVETILSEVEKPHQTMLFSATMPKQIKQIAREYMKSDYEHIAIESKTQTADTVKQYYYQVKLRDRFEALCRLIDVENIKTGIIFCRTKRSVDEVTELMQKANYSVEAMHGDLNQNHRMNTLRKFKKGTINFLVATDVAARGIDVENVTHVINYELPQDIESYVHRIGRTGRANKEGKAYSIITNKDRGFLRQIEKHTKSKIDLQEVPTLKEIVQAQMGSLLSDVEDIIFTGNHKKFMSTINDIDQSRLKEFASALLYMTYQERLGYEYTRETVNTVKENQNYGKVGSNQIRIFMTCGSMDRVKPGQIIDFFKRYGHIQEGDVGGIDIKRKFTFININKKVVHKLIKACNRKKINNRKVVIEVAK